MSSLWSGTNETSRNVIALRFDHLPLQDWGLSSRTLNALLRHNFKMTIGDVIRADETFMAIRGLGTAGFEELDAKVSQLFVTVHNEPEAQRSIAENGSSVLINSHASTRMPSRLLCSDGFLSGLQAEASEIARPPRAKRS